MLAHSFQKSCKDDRQVLSSLRDFGFCAIPSPALKCWAISRNQPERPNTSYLAKKERRSFDRRWLNDRLWEILKLFRHRCRVRRAVGVLVANVNYAVKSSLLLSFLESVPDVDAKLKDPNTKDEAFEGVVKSAQDAAVLVLVY